MNALISCERSGKVRAALRALGVDAWSCDLEPADDGSPFHIQGDAIASAYSRRWDLHIMHPPCTDLAVSGARWFAEKRADGRQQASIDFALTLWRAPAGAKALEQPVSILSRKEYLGKPTQIVQTVVVRAWRDQGDVSLAREPAGTHQDERSRGPRAACVEDGAGPGPRPQPLRDLQRVCRRRRTPVGRVPPAGPGSMTDPRKDPTADAIDALCCEWCRIKSTTPREYVVALGDRLHDMLRALAKEVGR